jgi:hypothetical protein
MKPGVYYWSAGTGAGYTDLIASFNNNVNIPQNSYVNLSANNPDGVFAYIDMINRNTSTSGISSDIIRSISISSPDDNHLATFVVSGIGTAVDFVTGNPVGVIGPITENIVGVNNNTVNSVNIYTVITSIKVIGHAATNIGVGPGPNGITNYFNLDCNVNVIQGYGSNVSVQIPNRTTMNVNIYTSLNKVESPNINGGLTPFGIINSTNISSIPDFLYDGPIIATGYFPIFYPFQLIWANVSTSGPDNMFFTVLQQGI